MTGKQSYIVLTLIATIYLTAAYEHKPLPSPDLTDEAKKVSVGGKLLIYFEKSEDARTLIEAEGEGSASATLSYKDGKVAISATADEGKLFVRYMGRESRTDKHEDKFEGEGKFFTFYPREDLNFSYVTADGTQKILKSGEANVVVTPLPDKEELKVFVYGKVEIQQKDASAERLS